MLAACALLCRPVRAQVTQHIGISALGQPADHGSYVEGISDDGRCVLLFSGATNLVAGDTNAAPDIFVRDRALGTTERVSVSATGEQANGESAGGRMSADGRFVAFMSWATNLVPNDTNGEPDVFIRDRSLGTTEAISVTPNGTVANGECEGAWSMTPDGRFVAFLSKASDLVPGTRGGLKQVFVRDRQTSTTEIVSVSNSGVEADQWCLGIAISDDGRFVAFGTWADNLAPGYTVPYLEIYLRDRWNRTTRLISLGSSGVRADGGCFLAGMSGDGRSVAFLSDASNLVTIAPPFFMNAYVRDWQSGITELLNVSTSGTPGNVDCEDLCMSRDGRFFAIETPATNLAPGDTNARDDIFVRDRYLHVTTRESVSSAGLQGPWDSRFPAISADGRFVGFQSYSTFAPGVGGNGDLYPYLRDRSQPRVFAGLCGPTSTDVIDCPCGNPPLVPEAGCDNSAGTGGAMLTAIGGTYVSSDDLQVRASGEPAAALSLLLSGTAELPQGTVYGRGVRCASGALTRLGTARAQGGTVTMPDWLAGEPTITERSAQLGDRISPGQSRWYVVLYRDAGPVGRCPASFALNATPTGRIDWEP